MTVEAHLNRMSHLINAAYENLSLAMKELNDAVAESGLTPSDKIMIDGSLCMAKILTTRDMADQVMTLAGVEGTEKLESSIAEIAQADKTVREAVAQMEAAILKMAPRRPNHLDMEPIGKRRKQLITGGAIAMTKALTLGSFLSGLAQSQFEDFESPKWPLRSSEIGEDELEH